MSLNPISFRTSGLYSSSYQDPYIGLFGQVWGTLSMIESTLFSITQMIFSTNPSQENKFRNELDQSGNTLTSLAQSLSSLRSQGEKPTTGAWVGNTDSSIQKCDTLTLMFENAAKDQAFIKCGWHFKEILADIKTIRQELLEVTKKFGWNSLYVSK